MQRPSQIISYGGGDMGSILKDFLIESNYTAPAEVLPLFIPLKSSNLNL